MATNEKPSWIRENAWWVGASAAVGVFIAAVSGLWGVLIYAAVNIVGVWYATSELGPRKPKLQQAIKTLVIFQLPVGLFSPVFVRGDMSVSDAVSSGSGDEETRLRSAGARDRQVPNNM